MDFLSETFSIGGFHWAFFVLNWVGVNLKCIGDYAAQKWKNDSKLHIVSTKHKADTHNEHLTHSDDCVSSLSWPPLKYMTSH